MRTPVITVGFIIAVLVVVLVGIGVSRQGIYSHAGVWNRGAHFAADSSQSSAQENDDAELAERLQKLCDRACNGGGDVGVAVIHVETGRTVAVRGTLQLPLYSVFKLPLAVSVLKEVEENRLRLDKKVLITPAEVAPGWKGNTDFWRRPIERTVAQLLELSIGRSDNTASDKLLQLAGGPEAVTQRMRSLGFQDIDIHFSTRESATARDKSNTGTASDLAHLLAQLQKGQILQPPQLTLLLGFMERATTGERRLRGNLPAGTRVADKTGTGEPGTSTNDVGLITLPKGRGHLAMAVLVSGSKLSPEAQEKLIAELARVAYDAHVSRAAQGAQ
jgi:beta-lactamase class A